MEAAVEEEEQEEEEALLLRPRQTMPLRCRSGLRPACSFALPGTAARAGGPRFRWPSDDDDDEEHGGRFMVGDRRERGMDLSEA